MDWCKTMIGGGWRSNPIVVHVITKQFHPNMLLHGVRYPMISSQKMSLYPVWCTILFAVDCTWSAWPASYHHLRPGISRKCRKLDRKSEMHHGISGGKPIIDGLGFLWFTILNHFCWCSRIIFPQFSQHFLRLPPVSPTFSQVFPSFPSIFPGFSRPKPSLHGGSGLRGHLCGAGHGGHALAMVGKLLRHEVWNSNIWLIFFLTHGSCMVIYL